MTGRAQVALKLATSLDGRIATASGESKWITGEAAREEVHRLRAAHDAVLVGSQTVIDDDPLLTVRLEGYDGPQPLRVVADGRLRTPTGSKLAQSAADDQPVLILTRPVEDGAGRKGRLEELMGGPDGRGDAGLGAAIVDSRPGAAGEGIDPGSMVDEISASLTNRGRRESAKGHSILVEGGGRIAASFIRNDLIDRIEWFRAPIILGADARPAVAVLEMVRLAGAPRFRRTAVRECGDDLWESYERA